MMDPLNRKQFLKLSALASGSIFIPKFLHGLGKSITPLAAESGKTLIVIQLSGGNDGLNTFIPFKNDLYYNLRPSLSYQSSAVLKVTSEMAFNPGMGAMQKIFDQGDMGIINNIGYPNPDHSHFRSMDIWTTASGSDQYFDTGWLGRYLDAQCNPCEHTHVAIEVDDTLSAALKGASAKGLAISNPERLYRVTRDPFIRQLSEGSNASANATSSRSYLYKTLTETSDSVEYVYDKSKIYKSTVQYPTNKFGNDLKLIAELICSGSETKVYYISLSGFDTHARQKQVHERLLTTLSEGLYAIITDLKKNNQFDQTMIMAFSEFGRRAKQNASEGTDHGEANNLLLFGGALKQKGFINELPDLNDLSQFNLKYGVDFRSVYATLLSKWLNADDQKIIGSTFEKMKFI